MEQKDKRQQYIRASDKRVAQWPVAKKEAFYLAVERITGKPNDTELEKKEMKINPIVNDYHFLIHPEMTGDEKYWCASTAEWKLSVTGYGNSPAKALKDLKKHLTNVIECMNKNNEPVILPNKPTNELKVLDIYVNEKHDDYDTDFIDYNRRPTESEIDKAIKGMEDTGIIIKSPWTKMTQDVKTWPHNGEFCWVKIDETEETYHRPVEFYCGRFIDYILPWENVYWAPAISPEFE
jgi:predicted RNase H-like HicB family nuclease